MSTVSNNDFAIEDEVFQVNLVRWARKKRLSFGVAIRRAGRIAAVNYAKHTQPFGMGQEARALGERAVSRDIHRVFVTGGLIYGLMRRAGDDGLNDAFYYFYQLGQWRRAQQLLEISHLDASWRQLPVGRLDPALHQGVRNNRGRVGGRQPPRQVVGVQRLATYVKQRQKMVGFAKAGYAVAARALGGTRGIPQWVTRHRTAPGSVVDAAEHSTDPHVVIRNHVDYASQCINETEKAEALRDTRDNLVKFLELQLGDDFSSSTTFDPRF